MSRTLLRIVLAVMASSAAAVSAQVLAPADVDEKALVDALTPPAATRSLNPQGGSAARTGRASLLIEFQTNSSKLTGTARQQLDIVGRALNTSRLATFSFSVEGHADPRGSAESNLKLSQARAESVRDYLVSTQNVASARLSAVGKGDKEPLNRNNPAAPENRRVTFVTLRP